MSARYDFEILTDGMVTASRRSVLLTDLTAACFSSMASEAERGSKIRVLDKDGRIVILTGVAAARGLFPRDVAA